MAEVNVTDISEATQLTTIAVLATQERGGIPLKTLASTKLIDNSLEAIGLPILAKSTLFVTLIQICVDALG